MENADQRHRGYGACTMGHASGTGASTAYAMLPVGEVEDAIPVKFFEPANTPYRTAA
jgi:hypothetical protein